MNTTVQFNPSSGWRPSLICVTPHVVWSHLEIPRQWPQCVRVKTMVCLHHKRNQITCLQHTHTHIHINEFLISKPFILVRVVMVGSGVFPRCEAGIHCMGHTPRWKWIRSDKWLLELWQWWRRRLQSIRSHPMCLNEWKQAVELPFLYGFHSYSEYTA